MSAPKNWPHVVIIGGGFAGLAAARELARARVRVTLVDRRNHHLFQPLLYQVATAALAAPDIATPIRMLLRRQQNATVVLREVVDIDVERRRVTLEAFNEDGGGDRELAYDYLVVAAGAWTTWFGHDDWAEHAPGLKSIEDAFDIRHRILGAYEEAELETDRARVEQLMTFVVVGGGATGVELAGALNEIARKTMRRNFRTFDPTVARVVLIEGGRQLLPGFPDDLADKARARLVREGVEVRFGQQVTHIDAAGVGLGEDFIPAATVLWAAGVRGSALGARLGAEVDRGGRVAVSETLALPARDEVFVVGDLARVEEPRRGGQVPGVAPAALQMGRHAARNISRRVAGKPYRPFRYVDKGMLATIGRSAAVARIGRLSFSGLSAWLVWLFVHIFFLASFRNRLVVLFQWAWAYLTWNRPGRIILERTPRAGRPGSGRPLANADAPPAEAIAPRTAPPPEESPQPAPPPA